MDGFIKPPSPRKPGKPTPFGLFIPKHPVPLSPRANRTRVERPSTLSSPVRGHFANRQQLLNVDVTPVDSAMPSQQTQQQLPTQQQGALSDSSWLNSASNTAALVQRKKRGRPADDHAASDPLEGKPSDMAMLTSAAAPDTLTKKRKYTRRSNKWAAADQGGEPRLKPLAPARPPLTRSDVSKENIEEGMAGGPMPTAESLFDCRDNGAALSKMVLRPPHKRIPSAKLREGMGLGTRPASGSDEMDQFAGAEKAEDVQRASRKKHHQPSTPRHRAGRGSSPTTPSPTSRKSSASLEQPPAAPQFQLHFQSQPLHIKSQSQPQHHQHQQPHQAYPKPFFLTPRRHASTSSRFRTTVTPTPVRIGLPASSSSPSKVSPVHRSSRPAHAKLRLDKTTLELFAEDNKNEQKINLPLGLLLKQRLLEAKEKVMRERMASLSALTPVSSAPSASSAGSSSGSASEEGPFKMAPRAPKCIGWGGKIGNNKGMVAGRVAQKWHISVNHRLLDPTPPRHTLSSGGGSSSLSTTVRHPLQRPASLAGSLLPPTLGQPFIARFAHDRKSGEASASQQLARKASQPQRKREDGERPYVCAWCKKTYKNRNGLAYHQERCTVLSQAKAETATRELFGGPGSGSGVEMSSPIVKPTTQGIAHVHAERRARGESARDAEAQGGAGRPGRKRKRIERQSQPGRRRGDRDWVIDCICGAQEDEGDMVQCDRCMAWLHLECVSKTKQELRGDYYCPRCTGDSTLAVLSTSTAAAACGQPKRKHQQLQEKVLQSQLRHKLHTKAKQTQRYPRKVEENELEESGESSGSEFAPMGLDRLFDGMLDEEPFSDSVGFGAGAVGAEEFLLNPHQTLVANWEEVASEQGLPGGYTGASTTMLTSSPMPWEFEDADIKEDGAGEDASLSTSAVSASADSSRLSGAPGESGANATQVGGGGGGFDLSLPFDDNLALSLANCLGLTTPWQERDVPSLVEDQENSSSSRLPTPHLAEAQPPAQCTQPQNDLAQKFALSPNASDHFAQLMDAFTTNPSSLSASSAEGACGPESAQMTVDALAGMGMGLNMSMGGVEFDPVEFERSLHSLINLDGDEV
ncbi:uncharacterized protein VTP21DRAFT_8002 [Calcarisporiella thermophila]|uniref:uncharacterized protein n=1 Tax=Calcarisporiella thermophila TaxID=911321 RepID=UPI003742F8B7